MLSAARRSITGSGPGSGAVGFLFGSELGWPIGDPGRRIGQNGGACPAIDIAERVRAIGRKRRWRLDRPAIALAAVEADDGAIAAGQTRPDHIEHIAFEHHDADQVGAADRGHRFRPRCPAGGGGKTDEKNQEASHGCLFCGEEMNRILPDANSSPFAASPRPGYGPGAGVRG